jgi:enolase
VAASSLYSQGSYDLGASFKQKELIDYYTQLIERYGLKSFEDPFAEDDYEAWQVFTAGIAHKRKVQVVGDDLTVTSEERIKMAQEKRLCNALIIKTNQAGTLSESLKAARLAREYGWELIVSHRSGDTEDSFIADLAVGLGASQIKLGAPCRGERTAKYNRLIEIEEFLKKKRYAGRSLKF